MSGFGDSCGGQSTPLLRETRISQPYAKRLNEAFQHVRHWLFVTFGIVAYTCAAEFDAQLEQYVQFMFGVDSSAKSYDFVKHAILSLQNKFRFLRKNLTTSWESMTTWKLRLPVALRVPIVQEAVESIFIWSLVLGFLRSPHEAGLWVPFAICVRLCYFVLGRIGEILGLR